MRTILASPFVVIALLALAPTASPAPAAKPQVTTTLLSLGVGQTLCGIPIAGPPWPCCGYLSGALQARFDATSIAGGFSVNAFFKPDGLSASGDIDGGVGGKASSTTTLVPGVPAEIVAGFLKLDGGKLVVRCSVTVDASGAVAVTSVYFDWSGSPPDCSNGHNGHGHSGGGPCTFC